MQKYFYAQKFFHNFVFNKIPLDRKCTIKTNKKALSIENKANFIWYS